MTIRSTAGAGRDALRPKETTEDGYRLPRRAVVSHVTEVLEVDDVVHQSDVWPFASRQFAVSLVGIELGRRSVHDLWDQCGKVRTAALPLAPGTPMFAH